MRRFVRAPLGRMCSKLDFFLSGIRNQPHLWMSRQARSVSRRPPNQGSTNFKSVYQNPKFRQVAFTILSDLFSEPICGFHRSLWKSCGTKSEAKSHRRADVHELEPMSSSLVGTFGLGPTQMHLAFSRDCRDKWRLSLAAEFLHFRQGRFQCDGHFTAGQITGGKYEFAD